ncbi:MAG TPA: hypothetical protein VMJ75_20360 [Candidatus Acidoferrales bacterium]|nr:hypothetical protein [Candidatus Acidoferrales bacterium]
MTRRQALLSLSAAARAAASPAGPPDVAPRIVERNDAAAENYLRSQVTDPASPWLGSVPDDYLLHHAGSAAGLLETLAASLLHPRSKHYQENLLVERIRLATGWLERRQNAEGNIDLLSTNFNSSPDTGFVVHNVATAAAIAKLYANDTVLRLLRPFLVKAGAGMASGGIHTPNHRWVVSSALAQVNDLFPNPRYEQRINQWLAEGIDIDDDGQYIERSTVTYNTVCDRAFTVMAAKLKRPDLLDPVRRNLRAMFYLLHPDGEVVTEVSRRQDQFVRGTMAGYWFPLQYLAARDSDGQFSALAQQLAPEYARLSALLEYPELSATLPAPAPLPENYEKSFPLVGLARIRRGPLDATMVLSGSSRFFSTRRGPAVINAVRFATSFFGKGQFVPAAASHENGAYVFRQSLDAPYYQPLLPPQKVTYKNWSALREARRKTQICRLDQSAAVAEHSSGFELRIQSAGTDGVPLAVEINLREGGQLSGCRPAPHADGAWLLEKDHAVYRIGGAELRFGPGAAPHLETQLRGAEPRLPGVSVYITGYTPFDHTIRFEFQG